MKIFKIRMISGMDCGIKGLEFQIQSNASTKPLGSEIKAKLEEMGYKIYGTPAINNYEVIG